MYSRGLIMAASLQVGYSSSMNTYRVVNVKPFRGAGVNELAINEQLSGGLEDQRSIGLKSLPVWLHRHNVH